MDESSQVDARESERRSSRERGLGGLDVKRLTQIGSSQTDAMRVIVSKCGPIGRSVFEESAEVKADTILTLVRLTHF